MNLRELESQVYEASIAKIAMRCRYDLYYLAKYILGYDLMTEGVHADLCKYAESLLPCHPADHQPMEDRDGTGMEDQFKTGNSNLLLLMPRGTFKSSVVTIGFSLQFILNEPNARIMIDSETFSKAKAFLSEVKGHLEGNEQYREVFKYIHGKYPDDGKRDTLWTDSQLIVSARSRPLKEPTFSCAGIDVTKNGMHYDLIIMDDLHSETNVTSKEQIDKVIDHWKLSYSLLDPGKALIVIGTRWDYNDLYQHILDTERDSYNIMIRRAIREDGSLFFPERLTEKFLEETKKKQGSRIFSAQYLNEPVDDESATFRRDNIIRKPWEEVKGRPINWYLSVDPSYEGEYSDYAALVVAGMDHQRDIYVRHVLRSKMNYSEIINQIFYLYGTFKPKTILVETVATQKSLSIELINEQKRRGTWLPVREIRQQTKSKVERIRALAPFYEFKHIYHIKECPQIDDLEYELIHFPRGKHDDIIDALASILTIASPTNAKVSVADDDKPTRRVNFKPRSPVTGY